MHRDFLICVFLHDFGRIHFKKFKEKKLHFYKLTQEGKKTSTWSDRWKAKTHSLECSSLPRAAVVAVEVTSRRSEPFVKVEQLLNNSQLLCHTAEMNSVYTRSLSGSFTSSSFTEFVMLLLCIYPSTLCSCHSKRETCSFPPSCLYSWTGPWCSQSSISISVLSLCSFLMIGCPSQTEHYNSR